MNVEKASLKRSGSLPAPWSGHAITIMSFCSFTYPRRSGLQPKFNQFLLFLKKSSLYYPKPLHNILLQSMHNFLNNVVYKETDRQTNTSESDNLLCQGGKQVSVQTKLLIPLFHYSRNAPRIHNVGHFFQILKVPSGVCKFRPAFALDSATFVAIAKCSQMQLSVGNLFHFPKNSWVHWEPNTTNIRVYEYDTMKQEHKATLVRTFVWIHCDMVEKERNARQLFYKLYDPYTNAIRYWRIREELGDNVVKFT